MKKIVLVGGGGHCKSVLDALLRGKEYDDIVITDPSIEPGTRVLGCRVVGNDDLIPKLREDGFDHAFVTLGSIQDTRIRRKLAGMIEAIGFEIPIIADPSAQISSYCAIGRGTFIGKNAVINADVSVGEHCIINTGAIVEHECSIGDFCHVSVGAILCGNVSVGHDSFIGAGATVIQGKHIGNSVIVGANSTVLTDVSDAMKAAGVVKGRRDM